MLEFVKTIGKYFLNIKGIGKKDNLAVLQMPLPDN